MLNEPKDRAREILIVDPGHILSPTCGRAAKAKADEAEDNVEDATAIWAHDHCRAHENFPGLGGLRLIQRALPSGCYLDAKSPGWWGVGLVPSQSSGEIVIVGIKAMGVDSGGACLEPDGGRR